MRLVLLCLRCSQSAALLRRTIRANLHDPCRRNRKRPDKDIAQAKSLKHRLATFNQERQMCLLRCGMLVQSELPHRKSLINDCAFVAVARTSVTDGASLGGRPPEAIIERIAGAAHGADRIRLAAAIERLAEPPDVNIHGALVDVDLGAPDAVE